MKKARSTLIFLADSALLLFAAGVAAGCRQEAEVVETVVSETVYAETLRVESPPEKVQYFVEDALDLKGLSVVYVQADGTCRELERDSYSVEPPDGAVLTEAGTHDVRVVYGDFAASFRVAVMKPVFAFWSQPEGAEIPMYADDYLLKATVFVDCSGELSYRWFRKNPNEAEFSEVFASDASAVEFGSWCEVSLPFSSLERNDYVLAEYYCTATLVSSGGRKSVDSDAAVICRTVGSGLPVVTVDTNDVPILNKEDWIPGTISIAGADDADWNCETVETFIRGRGNSTWNQKKKPYALKLGKKREMLGMPKHKRWVLIANYLDNSFIKNEMAFCLSRQLGMDWTVGGEYVQLVLNGEFLGLYWLGEAIKADENRVAIDEDDDYLMELDTYFDEAWKFKSEKKGLPYNIKNDDSMTDERLKDIEQWIAQIEGELYGDAADIRHIDVDSFAQFYVVNEVMRNGELGHPKSCYVLFDNTAHLLKAGPVWDFDWAAGRNDTDFIDRNTIYFGALFKTPEFNDAVSKYAARLDADAACARADAIRGAISSAAELDALRWGAHPNPVGSPPLDSFDEDFDFVKDVVRNRILWIAGESFSVPE
ncbi:MAG: CotH kinase family protein [Treponemataceae bacterium]|nr:CotH kinase family protein [Treponemataceae bacterium]